MNIDIFNGDADGICALIQFRLAYPAEAQLVTGVKRDIGLLNRVSAQPGDQLTVLDISLNTNRAALLNLLKNQICWRRAKIDQPYRLKFDQGAEPVFGVTGWG